MCKRRNMLPWLGMLCLWLALALAPGCGGGTTTPDGGGGDCGGACKDGEECVDGQFCLRKCEEGESRCGPTCHNLKTDKANCGACGTACKDGEACTDGACKAGGCPSSQTDCSGTCVNTKTDNANCGACGTACKDGEACTDGACKAGGCPSGQTDCSGTCVNTKTDNDNCGACGTACKDGEACTDGACKAGGCPSDQTDCSGTCVNTKTDNDNCGACGTKCGEKKACEESVCKCQGGLTDCNGTCADTQSSDAHCGACGNKCTTPQYCDVGTCVCANNLTACGSSCVDAKTDDNNCGTCGNKCKTGESCTDGACNSKCTAPEEYCAGTCTNTQTDDKHCGSCGNACSTGEACQAGTCAKTCPAGETVCAGACTNTQMDDKHCGSCGNACNTSEVCRKGACQSTWAYVATGDKSTRVDDITANTKGNVYTTGTRPRTDGKPGLFLLKNDTRGAATDLSTGITTPKTVGFHVDLSATKSVQTTGWNQVGGWRTGTPGLYNVGGAFDLGKGEFTAPVDGYYYFSAGLELDSANDPGNIVAITFGINGKVTEENGSYATDSRPRLRHGLTSQAVFKLTKGDKVTLHSLSTKDVPYYTNTESFFSGHLLGTTLPHGFHADLNATFVQVGSVANTSAAVTGWRVSGEPGLFANGGGFDATNGVFTAPVAGYYYFSSNLFFRDCHDADASKSDNQPTYLTAWLSINGSMGDTNGLIQREGENTRVRVSLRPAGLVYLARGDKVTLVVSGDAALPPQPGQSNPIGSQIDSHSGFSGFYLGSNVLQGFHAQLAKAQLVSNTGTNQLKGFRTSGAPGLFSTGGFDTTNGEWKASASGYYLLNAQVALDDADTGGDSSQSVKLKFLVNGVDASDKGTYVRRGGLTPRTFVHMATTLYLAKGDVLSIQVQSISDNYYSINAQTGFSGVLLDAPDAAIQGTGVTSDSNDSLYVSGQVSGKFLFGSQVLASGPMANFVARRKTDGSWDWVQVLAQSSPTAYAGKVSVDSNGSVYVCGNYTAAWSYASGKTLPAPTGGLDGFVAKLSSSGEVYWALPIQSSTGDSHKIRCRVTPGGQLYVTGAHKGQTKFGSITLNGSSSASYSYIARVKLDGSGFDWAKELNAPTAGLAVDSNENVYITGAFSSLQMDTTTLSSNSTDLFVIALDKSGKILWSQQSAASTGRAYGGSVAVLGSTVYVGGSFDGGLSAGNDSFTSKGKQDFFLGALDASSGKWLGARSAGGSEDEKDLQLTTDGSSLYMSGSFLSQTLNLGLQTVSKKQTTATDTDAVITKNLP